MFEVVVDPDYGIYADVQLIVDATNADDVDAGIENFETNVDEEWSVEAQPTFITSAPTSLPSGSPSLLPTTLQPSAKPFITGLVVTIDVTYLSNFDMNRH